MSTRPRRWLSGLPKHLTAGCVKGHEGADRDLDRDVVPHEALSLYLVADVVSDEDGVTVIRQRRKRLPGFFPDRGRVKRRVVVRALDVTVKPHLRLLVGGGKSTSSNLAIETEESENAREKDVVSVYQRDERKVHHGRRPDPRPTTQGAADGAGAPGSDTRAGPEPAVPGETERGLLIRGGRKGQIPVGGGARGRRQQGWRQRHWA